MTSYLLDTTVFIHHWRREAVVMDWIEAAIHRGDSLSTTAINVGETYGGARPEDRATWDAFFAQVPVFAIGIEEGAWAGRKQYDLARLGMQVHLPDALIASVAVAKSMTLVTANPKGFMAMGVPVLELAP